MFNYGMYNPYAPQMQRLQNLEQQYPQFAQQPQQSYPQNPQTYPQASLGLQGKSVDSIDVVKAMDIPLDGSVSYFPLTDGTAIVTKQLQADGTSKTTIYKPSVEPERVVEQPQYITEDKVIELINKEPQTVKELREEIKNLKRQLRDMTEDLKELREMKESKDTKRKSDD
jgi:hypothetical protein